MHVWQVHHASKHKDTWKCTARNHIYYLTKFLPNGKLAFFVVGAFETSQEDHNYSASPNASEGKVAVCTGREQ